MARILEKGRIRGCKSLFACKQVGSSVDAEPYVRRRGDFEARMVAKVGRGRSSRNAVRNTVVRHGIY